MDPNIKTIARVGSSNWMLFGGGFLGVGLFIALLFLTMRPWPIDFGEFAILAGVPLSLAAILMCVRSGVILDRQRRTIRTWWGLLVPFYRNRTEHSVSPAHFVTLSREERRARKGPNYVVFLVTLEGRGSDPIAIHEPGDHDKARRLAEELAKFLHLGIRDRTSGQEITREADALDQSLRERLRRAGQSVPLPAQPPGARAILSYRGNRAPTTIEIPPMPVGTCVRWFLNGICFAGIIAIVLELVAQFRWDVAIGVPTLCVFLPTLCILPLFLIRAAILRERLVVSPDEFVVTRRDFFGTRTTRLAGTEIEEVGLNQGIGYGGYSTRVVIRSDRRSIELVAALANPAEIKWLRAVIVHALTVTFD